MPDDQNLEMRLAVLSISYEYKVALKIISPHLLRNKKNHVVSPHVSL